MLKEIAEGIKASVPDVAAKIAHMNSEYKAALKELDTLKKSMAAGNSEDILANASTVGTFKVIAARMDVLDGDGLRDAADSFRDKIGSGVVVLASAKDSKVSIVAMATKDAVAAGCHCGNIVKKAASMCGGGGGGRPDMAQAGGKKPEGVDDMLKAIPNIIQEMLG